MKWCRITPLMLMIRKNSLKTVTPAIHVSVNRFDQLASQYEDTDEDLGNIVKINLPYCDNEDIDIDILVANNIQNKCVTEAANSKGVKKLIDLFDKSR